MNSLPLPVRLAAGLVATAVEQVRELPRLAIEFPVTAVSQALQASMRVQQKVTELAIKGDRVLGTLRTVEEKPSWATFDEDEPPRRNGANTVTALRPQTARRTTPPPAPVGTGSAAADASPSVDDVSDDTPAVTAPADTAPGVAAKITAAAAAGSGPTVGGSTPAAEPTRNGSAPDGSAPDGSARTRSTGTRRAAARPTARRSADTGLSAPTPAATGTAKAKPATAKPAATKPAATKPADTEPADTEPAVTEPAVTSVAASAPAVGVAPVGTPAVAAPTVTEPGAVGAVVTPNPVGDTGARESAAGNSALATTPRIAPADVSGPNVLPSYGSLTIPQLRGRLRHLNLGDLRALLEWENAHDARPPFVTMLSNRITTVIEG